MLEFNWTVYNKWLKFGFNYVQYKTFESCAVLSPLFNDRDDPDYGCTFKIESSEVVKMAAGQTEFPIYVLP
jgi:hypothetical protein